MVVMSPVHSPVHGPIQSPESRFCSIPQQSVWPRWPWPGLAHYTPQSLAKVAMGEQGSVLGSPSPLILIFARARKSEERRGRARE